MRDLAVDKLNLDGNIKIKISYDGNPVIFSVDGSGVKVTAASTVLLWSLPQHALSEIDSFEGLVRQKLCLEKAVFFEQQRKLAVSDDDIDFLWSRAVNFDQNTFRSFTEPQDFEALATVGTALNDDSWTIKPKHTLYIKPSHIWISKTKCGIIWSVVTS